MPRDFASDLSLALARNTPAFQAPPRLAGQSFVRQLLAALTRDTPAFQAAPAPPQSPGPEGGATARRPTRQDRVRERNTRRAPTTYRQTQQRKPLSRRREPERLLTVAEVAYLMQIKKTSVYRLIHTGHLSYARFGRTYRVPESAVHEYLRDSVRNVI